MSTGVRELCVFLASPSDVAEERERLRSIEQRVNVTMEPSGYRVRFLGWEHTAPGYGRPQSLINPDVDRCDVFIGVLAKRWGMPSSDDYGSGFHEEFERAVARVVRPSRVGEAPYAQGESAGPIVAMYFKRLPQEDIDDAGPQLKKVRKFRETIIKDRILLFKEWTTPADLVEQVVDLLLGHVMHLVTDEAENERERGAIGDSAPAQLAPPASVEAAELDEARIQLSGVLEDFGALVRGERSGGLDPDRLELMARAFGREKDLLGAHLVNRLYRRRAELVLSVGEHSLWAKTFVADQSVERDDRVVPGWGIVLGGGLNDDSLKDLIGDISQIKRSDITTGLLRMLKNTESLPPVLWEPDSEVYDASLWADILGSQPERSVLLDYLVSGCTLPGAFAVFSHLMHTATDPVTVDVIKGVWGAINVESRDFNKLAHVAAQKPGALVANLLKRNIESLSNEALFALAASTSEEMSDGAVVALARRDQIDGDSVGRLLRRRGSTADDAIVEAAKSDPRILMAIKEYTEKYGSYSSDLNVLEARVRAVLTSSDKLEAEVDAVPWAADSLEALMFAQPVRMADVARRILDDNAKTERIAIRKLDREENAQLLEDFVAQRCRSAACRLLGRLPEHTSQDARRVANEVIRSDKVHSVDLLLILSRMVTDEDLASLEDLGPDLGELEGYWWASEVQGLLSSPMGELLATAWRESDDQELNKASLIWRVRSEAVSEEELVSVLSDDRSAVRMAACEALIARTEGPRLLELLDRYQAGDGAYWYNVVCRIDEHLFWLERE